MTDPIADLLTRIRNANSNGYLDATANAYHGKRGGYDQPGMSGSEYCENEWRGNHRKQNWHERVTELLGLSDEQQEKIKAIREEERSKIETNYDTWYRESSLFR